MLTLTSRIHSESPINLTCKLLDSERMPEYQEWTQRKPMHASGEHADSSQKGSSRDSNQEVSCLEATVLLCLALHFRFLFFIGRSDPALEQFFLQTAWCFPPAFWCRPIFSLADLAADFRKIERKKKEESLQWRWSCQNNPYNFHFSLMQPQNCGQKAFCYVQVSCWII